MSKSSIIAILAIILMALPWFGAHLRNSPHSTPGWVR